MVGNVFAKRGVLQRPAGLGDRHVTKTSKRTPDRALVLRLIEQGYDKSAWHGPNLKSAIRRVSAKQASWRIKSDRHSIAEIVVHCAYWKYAVRRRIRGDKRGSFPLKGSNWFALPARLTDRQWRDHVVLLDSEHRILLDAVATVPWSRLTVGPGGGGQRPADHVFGVAAHDVYHAGQIQTLKKSSRRAGLA